MASNKAMIVFIAILVAAIVGINLIVASADQQVALTSTIIIRNQTVTAPGVNGTLELTGRELITAIRVNNVSNASQIVNGAILETSKATSDGLLGVRLRLNDTASTFAGQSVNVSYTAKPDGYIEGAPAAISSTVILFAVIGLILFVVIVLFLKGDLLEKIKNFGRK